MRTEQRGARSFYHALAALLFAAVCAWCAAALYQRLETAPAETETPEPAGFSAGGRFRGVLAREEEKIAAGAFPGHEAGARLSAAETGGDSALWFPSCDGWESLTPGELETLSVDALEAMMSAPEREGADAPRLVYGFTLWCAALYEGDKPPAPGPCAVAIDGEEAKGRLLAVTTDALGRKMLLLRLTEFPQELYERRFVEGEIVG